MLTIFKNIQNDPDKELRMLFIFTQIRRFTKGDRFNFVSNVFWKNKKISPDLKIVTGPG